MRLECDCGYVASGETDEALVDTVRGHAWQVHGTDLGGDVILAIADAREAPQSVPETTIDTGPSSCS